MITILQNIDPSITYALGWTIIHSLWQASLIALTMSIIHRYGINKESSFRYGVSVISMASVAVISVITFAIYYSSTPVQSEMIANIEFGPMSISEGNEGSTIGGLKSFFIDNIAHINLIWGVGVALFLARFVFAYLYTRVLRNTAHFANSTELGQILERLKNNLFIDKAISIAESSKIDVPLVLGHFKPLILFPIGMINMLSTAEVEAIITHELAHVKRYDYLTNILLTVVEILFYFHPAVWWISANVKAERENCCDDFALSQNIDKVVYAKALVKLEEIKSGGTPALAMPFSSKNHQLINRIKRIMNMPQTQNDIREKSIATVLLLSIFLLFNNQANSESSVLPEYNLDSQTGIDTIKLEGDDEMVISIKDGKVESLEVDNEILEGEIVSKIASKIGTNSTDKKSYTVTMSESPLLILTDDNVNFFANEGVIFESDDDGFMPQLRADTIPNSWEENTTSIFQKDNRTIEIEKKNGEVTKLTIDGKVIPKSEYKNYDEEIEVANEMHKFEIESNKFKHLKDGDFSKSFGLLFDGNNWKEFGGNFEQFMDKDMLKKLEEMEHMKFEFKGLEGLKELENLRELKGLEHLGEFEVLENMEELEKLEQILEEMGIKMDTAFSGMNFEFHNLDGLPQLEFLNEFEFDNDDVNIFRSEGSDYKRGTVVDKIGKMLNKDGLLEEYRANKIEITGKHLKINGEKMPKALYEKYKNIYQEATGAPLTKKSKMVFEVEGKPSKRKVKTY
jgi:beta-lactamase regulating signal transducer with metallopeptidase domain